MTHLNRAEVVMRQQLHFPQGVKYIHANPTHARRIQIFSPLPLLKPQSVCV